MSKTIQDEIRSIKFKLTSFSFCLVMDAATPPIGWSPFSRRKASSRSRPRRISRSMGVSFDLLFNKTCTLIKFAKIHDPRETLAQSQHVFFFFLPNQLVCLWSHQHLHGISTVDIKQKNVARCYLVDFSRSENTSILKERGNSSCGLNIYKTFLLLYYHFILFWFLFCKIVSMASSVTLFKLATM